MVSAPSKSRWIVCAAAAAVGLAMPAGLVSAQEKPASTPFRPPAVPLVASDPYLSVWSAADRLTDRNTTHWSGHPQSLLSVIRVDGKSLRLMGRDPHGIPALPQVSLGVMPTSTVYQFEGAGVHVTLTFLTPLLPHDLELMGRPLTYLTWEVKSVDGGAHAVQLLESTSSELAVDHSSQEVTWGRMPAGDLTLLKIGSVQQSLLSNAGDDTRIDWGYAYTGARADQSTAAIGGRGALLGSFVESGKLPVADDTRQPRPVDQDQPVCAIAFDLGQVSAEPITRQVMLAYDEIDAIKYFGKPLAPYWRRSGDGPAELFHKAAADYAVLVPRCQQFDHDLVADAQRLGGDSYAKIVALAYRQAWAGCGLAADAHQQPLLLTKENTSNGDIATVDVMFPMDPVWVLLSPGLAKASLVSNLMYSASPHWKFPNAPHDLGTYPIVGGRDDGGEGMPVEESGNMIILCDAIAQEEGSAVWVEPWWPQLSQWDSVSRKVRPRSRGPALHRRLHGPPRPQRQPFGEGDPGPGRLRRHVPAPRRHRYGHAVHESGQDRRPPLGAGRRRRRPLAACLRQARHLEPEVQPRLGPDLGPGHLPARGGREGNRLLQKAAAALRPAARQPHQAHQNRLVDLERHPGHQPRRLSPPSSTRS